jgi:hypothetical protein
MVRLLASDDPRWCPALGAAIGLGMLTKYTIPNRPIPLAILDGEQIEESGQPQWDSSRVRRDPELVEHETIGSSRADVASVNSLQELQRDEMMLDLSKEVG